MTTYNYNSELIKAMNEKLPNGTNLANTLIDMLYLGKEAVYRRLRGEVPFTLAEAAMISQKWEYRWTNWPGRMCIQMLYLI